jgi:hypothetical protein
MMKKYFLIIIFLFLVRFGYSQDMVFSSYISNINAFFNQTTADLLIFYEQGDYKIFPFLSTYGDTYWDMLSTGRYKNTSQVLNNMAGSFFRINKYLSIPIGFTMSSPSASYYDEGNHKSSQNFIINSGLILETKIGTLGGFIGWATGYNQHSYDHPVTNRSTFEHDEYSNLAYSIIPIIKVSEVPLLGLILKSIDGFFGIDTSDDSTSWSLNINSQPIIFDKWSILTIAPYILRTPFNLEADNEIYGLKTGIKIQDKFTLIIDGGYKIYTNVIGNVFSYEDTPFLRLTSPLWIRENGDWLGPTVYIDRALYTTKIGITGKQFKFPYALEMSFYPYLSVTAISTILFADVFPSMRRKSQEDN